MMNIQRFSLLPILLLSCPMIYAESSSSSSSSDDDSYFSGPDFTTSLSVVVLVTFIIVFSVCMEQFVMDPLKEAPEENPNLEPIVNVMFSELTLLGFVGLGMFIVEKLDLLSDPSYRIFHDKETLAELFEAIHMTVFLVMVLFLFNAFCLLQMGKKTSKKWKEANVRAIDEKDEVIKEYAEYLRKGERIPEDLEFTLSFIGLRQRFINNQAGVGESKKKKEEDVEEGKKEKKKIVKKKDEVPHDFELDEYFSNIMGKKAGEIIEIPVSTWVILELILVVMWLLKIPCTSFQFSIVFIFIGYLMMFISYLLDGHLKDVLSELIPAQHYEAAREIAFGKNKDPDEMTSLTDDSSKEQKYESIGTNGDNVKKQIVIPPFMMKPLQEIQEKHSGFSKMLFGRIPNKHEALFFGGAKGHDVLMQIVRLVALGSAIYLAIFLIVMLDPILDRFGHDYAILVLVLVLAAIPVFVNFYALNILVADFVIVSSVEMMRDTKTIQVVKRTMVTKKAMIALKLLNSMRAALKGGGEVSEIKKASEVWPDPHVRHEKEREMRELFDMFDTDQSGFIDEEEMNHLLEMQRIGDPETRKRVFKMLDQGGDGEISFEEFFDWIATQAEEEDEEIDEEKIEELAKQLFDLIDTPDENGDKDGVITPLEFYNCIANLCSKSGKMELSLEDIEAMFREVDEDGDGDLDIEEFEGMLKKYMFED